jgi:2,4-dienoyl-CoA reductase (NADPH2)
MVESPIVEYPFDEPGDVRMRIDDDRYIAEVSEIAEVIHRHGCPAFVQIYHRGPWLQPYAPNRPHIAASPVTPQYSEFDLHAETPPRELTVAEIHELTGLFAEIAGRIQRAGFDGMEINAGCDHIYSTFLSRFWNKRTDEYGCASMENRSRFLVETVNAIKKKCGADFPLSVLINAVEGGMGDEGMTYPESRALAGILESSGVDALHVRSHWLGHHVGSYNQENLFYPEPCVPLRDFPKGLDWSRRGKEVNVPQPR